ncbi:unnamed protein product [Ectocarpus sp. CCAP 1310/34]|nr:unnamed protein product [Ectocarpus sp. CCAP 1310/34]
MLPTSIPDASGNEKSGLDMYFLEQDGGTFKATVRTCRDRRAITCTHVCTKLSRPTAPNLFRSSRPNENLSHFMFALWRRSFLFSTKVFYKPYFYVLVKEERHIQDCIQCIRRRFEDSAVEVTVVDKEDLDMPNHLSGKLRRFLKLSFHSVADLMEVKRALMPTIQANKTRAEAQDAYMHAEAREQQPSDFLSVLVDAREYDVPYYVRCSIDLDIRLPMFFGW